MTIVRRGAWIALGLAVLVWRAGWGPFPDARWLATQIVPALPSVPPLAPLDQFTLSSPLGAFLAALVRAHDETSFELLHLAVMIGFAVGIGVLLVRRHGWTVAALVGSVFVGSQTSVVLLSWIGSYDVFTVGLTSLLVIVRDRRIAAGAGFLLAFSGFEQSVFVLLALLAVSSVGIGRDRGRLAGAAIGLAVGKVALEVWLRANDVTRGRFWFLQHTGASHVLLQFVQSLPWLVVTGLGASVVAVVVALRSLSGGRARLTVVGVLVAALVPVALSLDQTRVLAILTWPVVMALVLDHAERVAPEAVARLSRWVLALAAIVPGIVVWEGRAQLSAHSAWRVLVRRR